MFKFSPAKFFIYCALIFGIVLITLIPPFQSPDEDSHFKRAYVISQGNFYPTSQEGQAGFYLPNRMVDYISEKLTYMGDRDKKYSYSELVVDDRLPNDYTNQSFYNFSTAEVTPVAYIAPSIGIVFSRIVSTLIGLKDVSITYMLYFARFFSLIFYILVVALAIKITPILKKTFCMIGLIPMSLSLAAAISYDSVLISLTLLSTALIFKLIYDDSVKKIDYKYIITFGVIGFILLSVKTVYITVLLPLIFIPKIKYGNNKKGILKVLASIGGIIIVLYILNKIPNLFLKDVSHNYDTAASEQLSFILQHPINYIKIWIMSMLSNRNYYYSGIFGVFGLSDTYIITAFTVLYSIAFVLIVLSDVSISKIKFNWKYKIIALFGIITSIFGIFLAMYLLWTSIMDGFGIGAQNITGVQGRYFLPLLPLGIVLLSNKLLVKNSRIKCFLTKVLDNSYLISFIMLSISSITILLRFWC